MSQSSGSHKFYKVHVLQDVQFFIAVKTATFIVHFIALHRAGHKSTNDSSFAAANLSNYDDDSPTTNGSDKQLNKVVSKPHKVQSSMK
ncbi:unnamed protein product [Nippostrongylus brasiliensis]|uniref:Ovule protein n=1 Tax=Nippostrongylus brasiliensis TaxID=27835 RepID=A0A0N4YCV4_NIPBR|nr:unnamed protein product [Nippostrongylus brasiliensis]